MVWTTLERTSWKTKKVSARTFPMKNWKTLVVEVKRQIESVVEEKGWTGDQQLNQESSKGGERFKNSPINLMEDPKNTKEDKNEKESPELKEKLTEDELKGVDGGSALLYHKHGFETGIMT